MSGKLTKTDYEAVVPTLQDKVKRWNKVNVCLEVGDLDAMSLPALWEEIKQDAKHFNDFNRAAVVSDNNMLLKVATAAASTITPAEVKHFPTSEKAAALRWALGADPSQDTAREVYQS